MGLHSLLKCAQYVNMPRMKAVLESKQQMISSSLLQRTIANVDNHRKAYIVRLVGYASCYTRSAQLIKAYLAGTEREREEGLARLAGALREGTRTRELGPLEDLGALQGGHGGEGARSRPVVRPQQAHPSGRVVRLRHEPRHQVAQLRRIPLLAESNISSSMSSCLSPLRSLCNS